MGEIPADLFIYIIIAVVLVIWLRNTLGTRHGDEKTRPNPYAQDNSKQKTASAISMPLAQASDDTMQDPTAFFTFENESAKSGIEEIAKKDRFFEARNFTQNAKDAFSIIVEAFAEGDKETLSDLLSPSVYKAFAGAIDAREKAGERVETEIHAVLKADVVDAGVKGNMAQITFRIFAEETMVTYDADGEIIAGHPDHITEMADLWTFGRDIKSKDPTWTVLATDDGEVEPVKTPIPDAS